jgi:hypothetical protein
MLVGYKLLNEKNKVISTWGGVWGQTPSIPNPLMLPDGGVIHAPSPDEEYNGYMLIEWHIETAPVVVPYSITARQIRLQLFHQQLLDDTEAAIVAQGQASQITWEFGTDFNRSSDFITQLTTDLNLTSANMDTIFIEASKL